MTPSANSRTEQAATGAVLAVALAVYVWHAARYFPDAQGRVGADFRYFLPLLVAGDFWFQQNGVLRVPHFTPAFCGGMPLLGNPQGVVLSLTQVLLAVAEPVRAVFITLVLSAAAGAIGSYLLVVRCFRASVQAGALAALLFLFNGFLLYRIASGHLTYYAFGFVPLLAVVILSTHRAVRTPDGRPSRQILTATAIGGALIALITAAGALNYHLPMVLTVITLLLMVQVRSGFDLLPWVALAASGVWGIALSAMRLAPALVMAGQFERVYIPRFLFHNPIEQIELLLKGLFVPSLLPDRVWLPGGGILDRHEFELGLTVVPIALIGLAAGRWLYAGRQVARAESARVSLLLLLAAAAVPLVLTFGPWRWGMLLIEIPIINNNTTFVRWWSIYLLPIITIAALCFDRLARGPRQRLGLLVFCAAGAIAQTAWTTSPYYARAENTYDPGALVAAYRKARAGAGPPPIEGLASAVSPTGPETARWARVNDAFIDGQSAWPCYEPLFGYRLELTPRFGVVQGPIESASAGAAALNLVDPSAYFNGGSDRAWRFPAERRADARRFAAYQAYDWEVPAWQTAATSMSLVGSAATVLYLSVVLAGAIRRARVPGGRSAARTPR